MCARYVFFEPQDIKNFAKRFKTDPKTAITRLTKSFNIPPGTINPTVIRQSPNQLTMMRWGLVPFWEKNPATGQKLINARAEGIEAKPSFQKSIRARRCLVPSNGFYEWQTLKLEDKPEKIPWFIGLKDKKVFSFAGIYDVWQDAAGRKNHTYAIITCKPNEKVAKIHNRMPVILNEKDEDAWLNINTPLKQVLKLLKTFPAQETISWPVSKLVNKPANDKPSLIEPVKRVKRKKFL
jgi:putative SOS response-associated peptidase YedK